jgi:hypothetical protein
MEKLEILGGATIEEFVEWYKEFYKEGIVTNIEESPRYQEILNSMKDNTNPMKQLGLEILNIYKRFLIRSKIEKDELSYALTIKIITDFESTFSFITAIELFLKEKKKVMVVH